MNTFKNIQNTSKYFIFLPGNCGGVCSPSPAYQCGTWVVYAAATFEILSFLAW